MTIITSRRRSAGLFAGAALLGATLAVGGTSLALWADAEDLTGAIGSGYEYFAVGAPGGDLVPVEDGSVAFPIDGTGVATGLIDDGEFAVAIQADSLSQGNKGLGYHLAEPDWGDAILAAAEISVFWVPAAQDCHPGAEETTPPATIEGHTSTPVPATYSAGTQVSSEFWCLTAALQALPGEGEYANIATVTAEDTAGEQVQDTDDWHAQVSAGLDPADEPDHAIVFTYSTFRPGAMP